MQLLDIDKCVFRFNNNKYTGSSVDFTNDPSYVLDTGFTQAHNWAQWGFALRLKLATHAHGTGPWEGITASWGWSTAVGHAAPPLRRPKYLISCPLYSTALFTQMISGSCILFIFPSRAFQSDPQGPSLQQERKNLDIWARACWEPHQLKTL